MRTKDSENAFQMMEKILNCSFDLFMTQGLNKTSIADIVNKAGVAKGTFYYYFKDKYDIRNRLIAHKSSQLFMKAYRALKRAHVDNFEDRIVFIIFYVLDELSKNKKLLSFIYKDLSWAVFKKALTTPMGKDDVDFAKVYHKMIEESGHTFKDPEVMLFLIIELVGSTGYSSIMYSDPVSLEDLKPHLEVVIKNIIDQYLID